MIKISSILLVFLSSFFILVPRISIAQESSKEAQIKVDHVAGIFEKVSEKAILFFKFSGSEKAKYMRYLTEKRFAEMEYSIKAPGGSRIEEATSRYRTYAGNLANFLSPKKELSQEREETIKMYKNHSMITGKLQEKFEFESGWWLSIQHVTDSLRIYSDSLNP